MHCIVSEQQRNISRKTSQTVVTTLAFETHVSGPHAVGFFARCVVFGDTLYNCELQAETILGAC